MPRHQSINPNGCRDAAVLTSEERITMNKTLMPEPLDLTRLHSPEEVRLHATKVAAYRDAVREEEEAQRRKQDAAGAAANAFLSEDDYFKLALKRQQEQEERDAQRQAAQKAEKDAEAAYLASRPEVAEVLDRCEYKFLFRVAHWLAQGYELSED